MEAGSMSDTSGSIDSPGLTVNNSNDVFLQGQAATHAPVPMQLLVSITGCRDTGS